MSLKMHSFFSFFFSSAKICFCLCFLFSIEIVSNCRECELNQMQKIKVHKIAVTFWACYCCCCYWFLFLLLSFIRPFHTWSGFQSISISSIQYTFYTIFFFSFHMNAFSNACMSQLSAIISLWLLLIIKCYGNCIYLFGHFICSSLTWQSERNVVDFNDSNNDDKRAGGQNGQASGSDTTIVSCSLLVIQIEFNFPNRDLPPSQ